MENAGDGRIAEHPETSRNDLDRILKNRQQLGLISKQFVNGGGMLRNAGREDEA